MQPMAHLGLAAMAISAPEIAFQAEAYRRSQIPALSAENINYKNGSRTLSVLTEDVVLLAPADLSGNLLLRAAMSNLVNQGFESEQDVAYTMLTGWKAFAKAAAPLGHPDPPSCVMCRRLWTALTRTIVILEGGGGQVVQAAGVGLLDSQLPLKHAQAGERWEEEELVRLDGGIGAPGGSGSCLTPGSVSSGGKEGKGSSNMGLVSATDMDGREVTSGLKGLVTRLIELQGLRRLSDPGRVAEYQGTMVEFKPGHVRALVSMYATRAATFNATSLPSHWQSATLLPGLHGCRVLNDEDKFRRFLEVEISPLSLKDLCVFDFGPSSTPLSGCGDPNTVTSEFKDALLVALERMELTFMCFFGAGFEGVTSPLLARKLKARDGILYTCPDVILNYYVHNCLARFSYSVRYETAPDGEVWYGDVASAARLKAILREWVDTVGDLANSTIASFRMQILPSLTFGSSKHCRSDDGGASKDKTRTGKKKKAKSSGSTSSTGAGSSSSSGTAKSGSKGSSGSAGSATAGTGGGAASGKGSSAKPYCLYRLAELYGLKNLTGSVFSCRTAGACSKFHPSSKQEVDKDAAKKAVIASPQVKFGQELLKLIA